MPSISGVVKTDSKTITITGTGFYTSAYTAEALFEGIKADTTTIDSATQVTAKFTNGVPVANTAVSPVLKFLSTTMDVKKNPEWIHYAMNNDKVL